MVCDFIVVRSPDEEASGGTIIRLMRCLTTLLMIVVCLILLPLGVNLLGPITEQP